MEPASFTFSSTGLKAIGQATANRCTQGKVNAPERSSAAGRCRLGRGTGHQAFRVDGTTRVCKRRLAHHPSLVITLGMLIRSYRSVPFVTPIAKSRRMAVREVLAHVLEQILR